jgi:hypothetical protein
MIVFAIFVVIILNLYVGLIQIQFSLEESDL